MQLFARREHCTREHRTAPHGGSWHDAFTFWHNSTAGRASPCRRRWPPSPWTSATASMRARQASPAPPAPLQPPYAPCIGQGVSFEFDGTEVLYSNLGGQGPDHSAPPSMRSLSIHQTPSRRTAVISSSCYDAASGVRARDRTRPHPPWSCTWTRPPCSPRCCSGTVGRASRSS